MGEPAGQEPNGPFETGAGGDGDRVTVTIGPAGVPASPGAVMMVDQVSGLPSGTVTVRTTVAAFPEPLGIVRVTTAPTGAAPWVIVNVASEPEGLAPPGTASVVVQFQGGVQPRGGGPRRVTVTVGTVTVLPG